MPTAPQAGKATPALSCLLRAGFLWFALFALYGNSVSFLRRRRLVRTFYHRSDSAICVRVFLCSPVPSAPKHLGGACNAWRSGDCGTPCLASKNYTVWHYLPAPAVPAAAPWHFTFAAGIALTLPALRWLPAGAATTVPGDVPRARAGGWAWPHGRVATACWRAAIFATLSITILAASAYWAAWRVVAVLLFQIKRRDRRRAAAAGVAGGRQALGLWTCLPDIRWLLLRQTPYCIRNWHYRLATSCPGDVIHMYGVSAATA